MKVQDPLAFKKLIPVPESEWVDPEKIGGMRFIKDWIRKRKVLFTEEARKRNLSPPKGILIMGIPGTGKSMIVKSIPYVWGIPLFRMDVPVLLSGCFGPPEAVFSETLELAEKNAPCIVWIDEIEAGLGRTPDGNMAKDKALGLFLTWMQEHRSPVFVAATANRIEMVPAEMIRKGRFDEVFFVDVPKYPEERRQIIMQYIHKYAGIDYRSDRDAPFVHTFVDLTYEWTGAEIEQAIVDTVIESMASNTPWTAEKLIEYAKTFVPLCHTASKQINKLRQWAYDRIKHAN